MNMKNLFFALLSLFFISSINAQKHDSISMSKTQEVGFHGGFTTGVGFSYRYWPSKFGLQLTALPVKSDELTYFNFGVTGLYSIYSSRSVRFFWYLGNNYTYHSRYEIEYNSRNYVYSSDKKLKETTSYNIGLGPGFGFGSTVRFNIMAGYGFYDVLNKFNIYPTGEIGLYYRY